MADKGLDVAPRTVLGKKVKALRRGGVTPANIYGHKIDSTAVQAETAVLTHLLRGMTRNAIIDLRVAGEPQARPVVVREVDRDPVSTEILHVDFYQISMTEKMRAEVPVVLVGTSPAVSTYGGVLLQTLELVPVEALPGDIPAQFEVDVTLLTELEQSVHVRDLDVDTGKVTVHIDPDVVLARVASPRLATAEETAAEAAEAAAPAAGETPAAAPATGTAAEARPPQGVSRPG
ncbi:MAG: 50S ribosomal protein L25 [Chloroflexota bacterium]|nr:50S ribosomal protein L25 [Chloroflexota bacterium]